MAQNESYRIANMPRLARQVEHHLRQASADIREDDSDFAARIEPLLQEVPVEPIEGLLDQLLDDSTAVRVIGKEGERTEGLIFSALTAGQNPRIVKLYWKTALPREHTEKLLKKLAPHEPEPKRILGIQVPFQPPTKAQRVGKFLTASDYQEGIPAFYASAEILVRTIAHQVLPNIMPLPIALVNQDGQAIGLMVEHDREVARAINMVREDNLFGDLPFSEWRRDLPRQVYDIQGTLEENNVWVWQLQAWDLQEMLLLDSDLQFLTFARLGYMNPGVFKSALAATKERRSR